MPSNDGFILNHSKAFGVCHHVLYNPFSLAEAVEYAEVNKDIYTRNRDLNLKYVGKGRDLERKVQSPLVEISREWPKSRLQLFDLLSVTNTLYSYDSLSALNLEAIILGARVTPCNWEVIPGEYELNIDMDREWICEGYYEYASKYRRDLITFVEKTTAFFQGKL